MTQPEYSSNDLMMFDSIEHIRKRWKMYFHVDGIDSASVLLERLAQDPTHLGGGIVVASRFHEWYVIHSNLDWLPDDCNSDLPNPAFTEVTPFSTSNVNSFHYITYVAALADRLVSISAGQNRVLLGSVDDNDPIFDLPRPSEAVRTIAYVIDEDKYWG